MKDKKVFNILKILEDLKKGRVICVNEYAKILGVSVRSLHRYLEDIKSFYEIEFIKPKKGCVSLPHISNLKDKIIDLKESEDFEKFADILGVLNKEILEFLNVDEKIVKKIIKDDVLLIKDNPVENFFNINLYKKLKNAIKYKKIINIKYIADEKYFFENVKPLKIVFAQGNWYLATLSNDEINNGFKFLRINFIKDIEETSKSFKQDLEAIEFLKNFQTLFSQYKQKPFEVVLEIDKSIKRYFKVKKFLPSQEVIEEKDNLIIKYLITSEKEILPLIKQWIPHIKIKSPQFLREKVKDELQKYLTDNY